MNNREEILYYWLSLCPFSNAKKYKLISRFSIEELYDRIGSDPSFIETVGESNYIKATQLKDEAFLNKSLESMKNYDAKFISIKNEKYPEKLRQEEVVPPIGLYCIGDLNLLNTMCLAVVGTRHPTDYGKQVAEQLVEGLAGYNITIVSGMAAGIDAYAQNAALKYGVKTIAVLGSGINKPTPMGNINLYKKICQNGLVVSEYPINYDASKYTFPERNRIISGLSGASVIVEAAFKSGALITADRAAEQGREVFAVPGSIFSARSEGTLNLIKNGAPVFTSVKDILTFFNLQNTKNNKNNVLPPLDFFELSLYNLLQNGEKSIDELATESGFEIKEILGVLFSLEFKDLIISKPNNIYKLKGLVI